MKEQTIGERLSFAREEAGLTMTELADRAGVTLACVSFLESGRRKGTNAVTVRKLAVALGVSADWLGFGDGAQPRVKRVAS